MSGRAIFREPSASGIPVCNALHCDSTRRDRFLLADLLPFPASAYEISWWRSLLRPLTLALLCLAVSVVIWGLGYKLSLYHPHPNAPARTSVAKLWVGPRSGLSNATVRAKSTAYISLDLHGPLPRYIPFLIFNDAAPDASAKSTNTRFRLLLGTLRSPPSSVSK